MSFEKFNNRRNDYIKAVGRLEEVLARDIQDDIIIDALLQRYEFTFELAWKMLRSYIRYEGLSDEANAPRSTIRVAFKHGLIENGEIWIEMMEDRNRSSHVYDEGVAFEIGNKIKSKYMHEFKNLKEKMKTIDL